MSFPNCVSHVQYLDAPVSAARDYVVTGGDKGYAADVVVVALEGLDAFVCLEVPQLDGHVGRAGRKKLSTLRKKLKLKLY